MNPSDEQQLAKIRAFTEQFFARLDGVNLAYDADSIVILEDAIERNRTVLGENGREAMRLAFGYFLGECIRHNYGGKWETTEYGWGIKLAEKNYAFPFNKVGKQIENGLDDSISSFYDLIPLTGMISAMWETGDEEA